MFYITIIATLTYIALEVMNESEKKEELKKAKEEGYEVYFSR